MKEDNPVNKKGVIEKMSASLRRIGHKPYMQGGNGKPATEAQLMMYNALSKYDQSFEMEVIEKTGKLRQQFKSPNHYKIDIASRRLMVAIEVDGYTHSSKKIQECDQRKEQLLVLRGWTVLRFTNFQIQSELQNCVRKVLSTTSP
jgi:very-short-patch-repair endonuclease